MHYRGRDHSHFIYFGLLPGVSFSFASLRNLDSGEPIQLNLNLRLAQLANVYVDDTV